MSDLARRARAKVVFDGVDITDDIMPYLLSLSYTDNEEDEADDIQIKLQDRDDEWLENWLDEAVEAAAAGRLVISASILTENWNDDGKTIELPCGAFELDSICPEGPPSALTMKATALPFSGDARQTKKNKAWESYNLSGIAAEIAGNAGLGIMYESSSDPSYDRVEQYDESDIEFLKKLCHNAGVSLKVTDMTLVLFDQLEYEKKDAVFTIKKAKVGEAAVYSKYKLNMGSADTQYGSCHVSYTNPDTGAVIEGTAIAEGKSDSDSESKSKSSSDAESEQVLEITAKVNSVSEAQELAKKMLRLHNKYERTATFNLPGNTALVAGVNVELEGFGGWDAKYMIKNAKHSISSSGYTTSITLRRILEAY